MRWDNLFDDLEGQLEQELARDDADLAVEEERLRLGRLTLRDRLRGIAAAEGRHTAYSIRVHLMDGSMVDVRPVTVGRDWFSAEIFSSPGGPAESHLAGGARRASHPVPPARTAGHVTREPQPVRAVVSLGAVAGLELSRAEVRRSLGAPPEAESEPGLQARLTLSFALRDLCRRRAQVDVRLPGTTATGTIDRVGRDHVDLALHESGSARREAAVTQYRVVPFAQVLLVRW